MCKSDAVTGLVAGYFRIGRGTDKEGGIADNHIILLGWLEILNTYIKKLNPVAPGGVGDILPGLTTGSGSSSTPWMVCASGNRCAAISAINPLPEPISSIVPAPSPSNQAPNKTPSVPTFIAQRSCLMMNCLNWNMEKRLQITNYSVQRAASSVQLKKDGRLQMAVKKASSVQCLAFS